MISGLVQLFLWQALGELASKFLLPNIPGPVLGLVFLVIFLFVRGEVNAPLASVADGFRQHLGLLFVPASVGVILFFAGFANARAGSESSVACECCARDWCDGCCVENILVYFT